MVSAFPAAFMQPFLSIHKNTKEIIELPHPPYQQLWCYSSLTWYKITPTHHHFSSGGDLAERWWVADIPGSVLLCSEQPIAAQLCLSTCRNVPIFPPIASGWSIKVTVTPTNTHEICSQRIWWSGALLLRISINFAVCMIF